MGQVLIGDKNVFGVQYEVEMDDPIVMIRNCLWIQGKFIGNYDDSGAASSIVRGLKRLISYQGDFYEDVFLNKNPGDVMSIIAPDLIDTELKFEDLPEEKRNQLVRYDKYRFWFGENYDDFSIRVYAVGGMYYFSWILLSEDWQETGESCYKDYGRGIQSGTVLFSDLQNVYDSLVKELNVFDSTS